MSLIKQIEDAETKDQLEALGKQHLGVDVDKRKGVETLRAELQELAEAQAEQGVTEARDTERPGDPEAPADSDGGTASGEPVTAPTQGDTQGEEAVEGGSKYQGRLLRHRKTGRLFPWTAQLAKKRDLQEV